MKKIAPLIALLVTSFISASPTHAQDSIMSKDQVIAEANKMAVTQFDSMHGNFWGRYWVDGVFWAGVADLAKVSDEPRLRQALDQMGKQGKWELLMSNKEEPDHADDLCIGQAFLDIYATTKNPAAIADTQKRLDHASAVMLSPEMAAKAAQAATLPWNKALTWYWCDSLFMAAPVYARLSVLTGDPKYLQAMDTEWKRTSALLYDPEEHLYFRDKNFLTKVSKNGKKVFWSRGNGWVMGALAQSLPYIPKGDPRREWYVNHLKELATKLASIQQPDGTWSPSLLDYQQFPYAEMSGTALNTFGIAWGINNGVLDEKTFRPVVEKAWAALLAARNEKGFLGYVQGVGAEPGKVYADQATWYGNGAFLMAAAQLAQMAPLTLPPAPVLKCAPPRPKKITPSRPPLPSKQSPSVPTATP